MEDENESPFGEPISKYTLEDAIEDGTHVDFGKLMGYRVIMTTGLLSTLNTFQIVHALVKTLNGLTSKIDMVIFKTEKIEPYVEDQGRTMVTHIDGLEKKVYAKNDAGTITIFLAEEY